MASVAADPRYKVSADDRAECIDLVNRLNWAFDEWDVETMVAAFTEDGTVRHPRGDIRGHARLRDFYAGYRPLTLGVRRQAANHVVDGLPGDLVRVTSYNQLIRVGPAEEDRLVRTRIMTEYADGFPVISMHALMIDIFRRDPGHGWRICSRSSERNVVNRRLR